jgi:putative Mn2+ efflux pump MntP
VQFWLSAMLEVLCLARNFISRCFGFRRSFAGAECVVEMDIVEVLFMAVGLAMDALAVSVANGMSAKKLKWDNALKMAFSFGSFQAFMPVLGWLAGVNLMGLISGFDHWAAFALLFVIGFKMIFEAVRAKSDGQGQASLNFSALLFLSVATSIDALAVGVNFAFLRASIIAPIIVIGVVTFLLSFLGVCLGSKVGHFLEKRIGMLCGFILIGIGLKILLDHMF